MIFFAHQRTHVPPQPLSITGTGHAHAYNYMYQNIPSTNRICKFQLIIAINAAQFG